MSADQPVERLLVFGFQVERSLLFFIHDDGRSVEHVTRLDAGTLERHILESAHVLVRGKPRELGALSETNHCGDDFLLGSQRSQDFIRIIPVRELHRGLALAGRDLRQHAQISKKALPEGDQLKDKEGDRGDRDRHGGSQEYDPRKFSADGDVG
jgi:hypothetical protein